MSNNASATTLREPLGGPRDPASNRPAQSSQRDPLVDYMPDAETAPHAPDYSSGPRGNAETKPGATSTNVDSPFTSNQRLRDITCRTCPFSTLKMLR